MKKLILSVSLMALALALQAGDDKATGCTTSDKPACCAKAKAANAQAKSECCMAKQAKAGGAATCPYAAKNAKTCKNAATKQQALLSPKAAGESK